MLRDGVVYIRKAQFDKLFERLGYIEGAFEVRVNGCITYVRSSSSKSLPIAVTMSAVELARDGTLCYCIDGILDLLDRLSNLPDDESIIIRLIKDVKQESFKTVDKMDASRAQEKRTET